MKNTLGDAYPRVEDSLMFMPAGDLTPCPVSNVATHNLTSATLRKGFASPLFAKNRENESLLETEGTPMFFICSS